MRTRACIAFVLAVAPAISSAQDSPSFYDFTRSRLSWFTIETEHFKVHFHQDSDEVGASRSARAVAEAAEEAYGPITELYRHEPDSKVSIVLRDFEDYSNGAAYFFDNVIFLWAPALDTPLRGRHSWLRNVVTHEFTHIVQVQASMKGSRHLPFQYFQLLTYEDVRRPDVLYGYPNGIVTYPIPVLSNPAWLAEGTAQFQRTDLDYDTWDTHRDMLLRTRVLAGEALSLANMGGFYSHNSLERETVYNQGFAFTQFLAAEYGEDGLQRLTDALGSWKVWNFDGAARKAFGRSGRDLYNEWIGRLSTDYALAVANVIRHQVEGEVIEGEGFLNLQPQFSPNGRRLAYLSNKGRDFSSTALYVIDTENDGEVVSIDGTDAYSASYTCSFGNRVSPAVYGGFDWRPDGTTLAYSRRKDTPDGSYFADLYEYNLDTRTGRRLTWNARARSPSYSPDGRRIAFVSERDGTSNIYLLTIDSGDIRQVTFFEAGEEVGRPVWPAGGEALYLTYASGSSSNGIYRVSLTDGSVAAVVDSPADERDPWVSADGRFLYFASDRSGIFNIYRRPLAAEDTASEQITNVLGGAFMPSTSATGTLAFSRYDWDGYKIAALEAPQALPRETLSTYNAPGLLTKWKSLPQEVLASHAVQRSESAASRGVLEATSEMTTSNGLSSSAKPFSGDSMSVVGYRSDFTSFSLFPVLRLDQYVSRKQGRADVRLRSRTRGETLLRNTKVGFYVASREVLDGFSMLGGLLVGPASGSAESVGDFFAPSSLLDLERDLFVQFDYRKGVFFRSKRWSPQFSLQLFNVRRNVENGLAFEELACTACFPPDTTLADLSYNLWELDLAARSKITRNLLVEAGYRFSPYRVTTESFFSTEFQQTIPASSSRYFIGRALRLKLYFEALRPHRDADVVRDGISASLTYEFEPGRLLDRFEVEDGVLAPRYQSFRNHRLGLDLKYGVRIGRPGRAAHGVMLRARATTILGGPVDDFFDDYVGGLIGARGYPFYALGGNETLWFQLSYSMPVFPRIQRQLWFLYVDKLYARFYGDAAFAWSGSFPGLSDARRDVGAELRLGLGSFYLVPTAVFVSGTYGLDEFEFMLDQEFVTPDGQSSVSYGRDLQWHFGVLFDFDL